MIVVAGPTASGKTELALSLARQLGGEVVSADSRQVYRRLSAGTAKPVLDAQGLCEGVPYHLVDLIEPAETFDAGRFAKLALPLCEDITERGLVPIVAGGTGLYIKALLEGLNDLPERNPEIREKLEGVAEKFGLAALHKRLESIDPDAARAIPPANRQRLLRALEVFEVTGRPISSFWKEPRRGAWTGPVKIIKLDPPLPVLKERIAKRAEVMWPNMLAELEALGPIVRQWKPALESLGYAEALACLDGKLSRGAGLERTIAATNAYAKRQRTWFKNQLAAAKPTPYETTASA